MNGLQSNIEIVTQVKVEQPSPNELLQQIRVEQLTRKAYYYLGRINDCMLDIDDQLKKQYPDMYDPEPRKLYLNEERTEIIDKYEPK